MSKTCKTVHAEACALVLALVALTPLNAANAATLAYEVTAGAGNTDNIARVPENEQSEDIATAGVKFSLDEQTARLQADLVGDLAYYDYLGGTFDSEVLGNFVGTARASLIPERLNWVLSDNFGQVLTDPFIPPTPENRENLNYLSTGPQATLSFGSKTELDLGALYSLTSYDESPLDSSGLMAEVGLSRLMTSASSLGLHVRAEQVEYKEQELDGDYDQSEIFLRYAADGSRTHVNVDAGHTSIDRDATPGSESGFLFRADLSRRVSARSLMTLEAGQQFSSPGSSFADAQSSGTIGQGTVPSRQTVNPFVDRYVTLGWNFQSARTDIALYGSWRDQTYEDELQLDQTITAIGGSVSRAISPMTRVQLEAVQTRAKFEQPGGDYVDLTGRLSLQWNVSRRVALSVSFDYADRDSDLAIADYSENRYWLSIAYQHGVPRATVLPPRFRVDAANPVAE